MKPYFVTASAPVKAPAEQVYAILADYRDGHPHILPKQYFLSLEVEQGGFGAGTLIRFQMRILGKTYTLRAAITEPEPGRVLVETDPDTRIVTTFIVKPLEQGQQAEVTITTEGNVRNKGLPGLLERFFTPMLLRRIYVQELALIAAYAEERFQRLGADTPTRS
jgi:hypothetical protein